MHNKTNIPIFLDLQLAKQLSIERDNSSGSSSPCLIHGCSDKLIPVIYQVMISAYTVCHVYFDRN